MIERKLWQELKKYLDEKQALVITGPRRVGKTTTLRWLLAQTRSKNQIFFDLENLADRAIFEVVDYNDVIETLKTRGLDVKSKLYVAIDEIQFLPNITSVIKYLYDHYDIKFYLSGSSSYYLKNHFSESMSGRKYLFELLPLAFQEFLDLRGAKYVLPEVDWGQVATFPNALFDELQNYYEEYIKFGGFPDVVLAESKEVKKRLITEFYSTYINQDVLSLADFRDTSGLRKLVSLLAARIGNRINILELSNVSGLSRDTINVYIEFLERTYLIRTIGVESTSEDVKIRNLKKLYFVDNGIAAINADLSSGQKFENALAAQLAGYGELSYYDNGRQEVDFILRPKSGGTIALEAKETPTETDLRTLEFVAASRLKVDDFAVIGRQKSQKFVNYRYGGELG